MYSNYIEFLIGVHKGYDKFVLFLDNAAYHKSKALKEFLVGMGDEIKIVHFPPIHAGSESNRGAVRDVQKIHRKSSVSKC